MSKTVKDFGLRDQIQRSAVSIASNIAEGDQRESDKEAVRFFYIARGSIAELETQLIITKEIEYINPQVCDNLLEETKTIGRMLNAIIKHRKQKYITS